MNVAPKLDTHYGIARFLCRHNQTIIMADTSVTVDEPDLVTDKSVDSSGRLYLGRDFADKHVRLVVKEMDAVEGVTDDE